MSQWDDDWPSTDCKSQDDENQGCVLAYECTWTAVFVCVCDHETVKPGRLERCGGGGGVGGVTV